MTLHVRERPSRTSKAAGGADATTPAMRHAGKPVARRRIVIAFDASGSMAGRFGGTTKMEAAREAVDALLDGVPDDVTLGLVAFGHKGSNDDAGRSESCAGVETLAKDEFGGAGLRRPVEALTPTGWTPLAAALDASGTQLSASGTLGEQIVYVVSDGEETCGGDPIAAARTLHEGGMRAVVNILGMDLPPKERAQLEAVAAAGGGLFTPVESESELSGWISDMRRENANLAEILRTRNQAFATQLRNTNATSGTLLRLDNCVAGRALREGNGLRRWMREQDVPSDRQAALREALVQGREAYTARAAEIRAAAEATRDTANTAVQEQLDGAEERYDSTR